MTDQSVSATDFDKVVSRLLDRLLELEAAKQTGGNQTEALRGVRANQLDARGNRGGIWYVIESKWSIVAIAIAALALGVSMATTSTVLVKMMEAQREVSREERLKTQAIDDLRMEFRAVLREAGIQAEAPENTDVSKLAKEATKGKKP